MTVECVFVDDLQPRRTSLEEPRLNTCLAALDAGKDLDPIHVYRVDGDLVIEHGHHRAYAHLERRIGLVRATVEQCPDYAVSGYRAEVAAARAAGVHRLSDIRAWR